MAHDIWEMVVGGSAAFLTLGAAHLAGAEDWAAVLAAFAGAVLATEALLRHR